MESTTALMRAIMAWRQSGLRVTMPDLVEGNSSNCEDDRGTIACADMKKNRIILVSQTAYHDMHLKADDLKTIMMHEVGHLLGVPHIEGDPLMEQAYNGKPLSKPTPFAVAIARAYAANLQAILHP